MNLKVLLIAACVTAQEMCTTNHDFSEPIEEQAPEATCILGTQTGCSTSVAIGLTNQIANELNNMGYTFTTLDSRWIHCDSPCVPKLQAAAAKSLRSVAIGQDDYITLNSAWRSAAQQYLLYNWSNKGICGIGLAAVPGTSNHEGGKAIDTSYYSYWLSPLEKGGWAHPYPSSDPVHFEYGSAPDLAQKNLVAF